MRMNRFPRLIIVSLVSGLLVAGCGAQQNDAKTPANNQTTASTAMAPGLNKDMADMYQKMADCLRTGKSVDQCADDAMKNCPVMEKTGRCPIHDGLGTAMSKDLSHSEGGMRGMDNNEMNNHPPAMGGE